MLLRNSTSVVIRIFPHITKTSNPPPRPCILHPQILVEDKGPGTIQVRPTTGTNHL